MYVCVCVCIGEFKRLWRFDSHILRSLLPPFPICHPCHNRENNKSAIVLLQHFNIQAFLTHTGMIILWTDKTVFKLELYTWKEYESVAVFQFLTILHSSHLPPKQILTSFWPDWCIWSYDSGICCGNRRIELPMAHSIPWQPCSSSCVTRGWVTSLVLAHWPPPFPSAT